VPRSHRLGCISRSLNRSINSGCYNSCDKENFLNIERIGKEVMREATIFNKINARPEFGFSGADIARTSALDKSLISRFLNEKGDINLNKFSQLICSMPPAFQQEFWKEFHTLADPNEFRKADKQIPWTALVSEATYDDLEEILSAIAARWSDLSKSKNKELAGAG
jgi:hypothetical protein